MSGAPRAAALTATALLLAALSFAVSARGFPVPGGTVPSTLSLSLSEPGPLRRVGRTPEGRNVYVTSVRAEVTATDTPSSLGLGLPATPLRLWREPLLVAQAKLRLREVASDARALAGKTEVITLTAGGP